MNKEVRDIFRTAQCYEFYFEGKKVIGIGFADDGKDTAMRADACKEDPEAWREEYMAKQAAGGRFQKRFLDGTWHLGLWEFTQTKEDYREVQEAPKPTIPHLAERILWLQQRAAGTNEVWQLSPSENEWVDLSRNEEPNWEPHCKYRVKPKKVTYYMAMVKHQSGVVDSLCRDKKETIFKAVRRHNAIIIGDIEERGV